jgi:hypothetical protein
MYLERMQTLERLHTLIHRKATGDRTTLARKLDTSERSVYRMLDHLRYLGAEIGYDSERPSYYYVNDFALQVTVKVWIDGEEFLIIGGGVNLELVGISLLVRTEPNFVLIKAR